MNSDPGRVPGALLFFDYFYQAVNEYEFSAVYAIEA